MYSIGALAKHTGVKVPTIRYYEQVGLLSEPERTEGNQRRYGYAEFEKLGFIKHARDLGFPIEAIASLISLNDHPNRSCAAAAKIAQRQLTDVREKIASLVRLESELSRIAGGCSGAGVADDCYVLASLADHAGCAAEH